MIKFSKLFETVYEPRSGDEKNFKDKHVIMKIKTPYDTESQFTSDKPKAKRKADYDTKDDESVYEAANVHTKRADKEAVIVRAVDPKTGESRARVIQRRAGEIKIGEEVEQIDELSKDTLHSYMKKSVPDFLKTKKSAEKLKMTPKNAGKIAKAAIKLRNRAAGVNLATKKMAEEVEMIDEAVKVGAMKLHDGSSITVTREMADKLNNVLEQLNPMNRVKMEEKLHTSKKDFMELLKFAENV
jgi:hypothetical protein